MKRSSLCVLTCLCLATTGLLVLFQEDEPSLQHTSLDESQASARTGAEVVSPAIDSSELQTAAKPLQSAPASSHGPVARSTKRTTSLPAGLTSHDPKQQARAAMQLAEVLSPDQVDGLLDLYAATSNRRSRLLLLYAMARSRERFGHEGRDRLLEGAGFEDAIKGTKGPRSEAGVAVLTLGALGSERSAKALAALGQDFRDPVRAADSLMTLARFSSPTGVNALKRLASEPKADATRVKALQALLATIRASQDTNPHSAAGDAKRFLHSDGLFIARQIAESGKLASVRSQARSLLQEIARLS
jgi:hypothetical protein